MPAPALQLPAQDLTTPLYSMERIPGVLWAHRLANGQLEPRYNYGTIPNLRDERSTYYDTPVRVRWTWLPDDAPPSAAPWVFDGYGAQARGEHHAPYYTRASRQSPSIHDTRAQMLGYCSDTSRVRRMRLHVTIDD